MVTATSPTAAAASIDGRRGQTTSLESTSATTTYHRMTIDGVIRGRWRGVTLTESWKIYVRNEQTLLTNGNADLQVRSRG